MRCWIITVGEPLPIDGADERRLRSGILAQMLADAGHDVIWWTGSFDHWRKTHFSDGHATVRMAPNYDIVLLRGRGYRSNISLGRIRDHREVARAFAELAPLMPVPDIIVASLPTLELSAAAVAYARSRGSAVVVDVRDMWPDVMLRAAPWWLSPIARVPLLPMRRLARRACAGATAITGHTSAFVEWGVRHARRNASPLDRDFPFGYERPTIAPPSERADAIEFWTQHGVTADRETLTVCFAGTLSHSFDFAPVLDAARRLARERVRFVICGTGDGVDGLRAAAADLPNVVLPGWVQRARLQALFAISDVGIAPYKNELDFRATIPNKAPEYLSAGLPIALSLPEGVLFELLRDADCGFTYGGDASRLASSLVALRDDHLRREQMKASARALYDARFRADVVYGSMIRYLETVARDAPRVAVT